jgi:hypothetical protein
MNSSNKCEYCDRPIKGEPEIKTLRGTEHIFCSEFCFRLFLYSAPNITYEELKKMYALRFIPIYAPDLHELIEE